MTPEQASFLSYTLGHFKAIAEQNRFAENNILPHDPSRCVICHPELLPTDPFTTYLKVVTEAIKVRRPRLDQSLVSEINSDLALAGEAGHVSRASLLAGDRLALRCWSGWVREALATGLGLLSIHSASSRDFALEDAEDQGLSGAVEAAAEEIMAFQKQNA
jgi:hypothetical protein